MSEFTREEAIQIKALRGRVARLEKYLELINNHNPIALKGLGFEASDSKRVDVIRDEDDMASDDANALATQQSIKAYADAIESASLQNVVEDTSPELGGDLSGGNHIIDYVSRVKTRQTADDKGNVVYGYDDKSGEYLHIYIGPNGKAYILGSDSVIIQSDVGGAKTLYLYPGSNLAVYFRNKSGGYHQAWYNSDWGLVASLDSSGRFRSKTLLFLDGGATVDIIRDEDTMSSNDANALATQQSIKAYVDKSCYVETGTYTGNGSTSQTINLADSSLKIKMLWTFVRSTSDNARNDIFFTTDTIVDDIATYGAALRFYDGNAVIPYQQQQRIRSVSTGSFVVDDRSADYHPNKNGQVYNYIAFGTH